MNERLGILEERQAIAAKYARFAYVAPQDRVPARERPVVIAADPKPKPIVPPRLRLRGAGNGKPIEDIECMTLKVRDVIACFAQAFEVGIEGVLSPDRQQKFSRPRRAIMHYLSRHLHLSTPSIGKVLQRDHTSCVYGIGSATAFLANSLSFRSRYDYAGHLLRKRWAVK